MTKTKRVIHVLQGLTMLLFAAALVGFPEAGLYVAAAVISLGLTLRGAGSLIYYFRMARSMVGGKTVLYRGIIYLDLGLFSASLVENGKLVIVCYLAVVNAVSGVIAALRAAEQKREGSGLWKYNAVSAVISAGVTGAVILCEILQVHTDIVVYVYAAGMLYAAVQRIAGALRRTAIVYIP